MSNNLSGGPDNAEISRRLERIERVFAGAGAGSNDDIDLRGLFREFWRGKWFIGGVAGLFTVVAMVVAINLPNEYKATILLSPASTSGSSALSRLAGQFGGLAALAGVNLGSQPEGDKTTAAIEVLKSWSFQEQFVRANQLEVSLVAAKGWDSSTRQLVIDTDIFDVKQGKWVKKFESVDGKVTEPSGWELYKTLRKRISVNHDKKTGLVSVSFEYYSPHLAKEWLEKIILAVNKHLQEQDRADAAKSIEYLKIKMNGTDLTEMRSVFAQLIEEQMKSLMLADVSDEYALKTLGPAKVPEEKSRPKRALICVVGAVLGGILATIIWFFWMMGRVRSKNAI